jgi:hypothetical protein
MSAWSTNAEPDEEADEEGCALTADLMMALGECIAMSGSRSSADCDTEA